MFSFGDKVNIFLMTGTINRINFNKQQVLSHKQKELLLSAKRKNKIILHRTRSKCATSLGFRSEILFPFVPYRKARRGSISVEE